MNAPAPGWQPDPTQRHEYRYWDGARWTDDVSDGGVTSVDPMAAAQAPSGFPSGDATVPFTPNPTEQFGGQPPGSAPGGPGGPAGYGSSGGYPPYGGGSYGSGPMPPGQPVKKGPSTGLLVGIGLVVVALIAGLAFVLTSGDDDDDGTAIGDSDATTTTAADDDTTTTATDDSTSDTTAPDLGDDDTIVEAMASGIESSAGGAINHDQAVCVAQGMVDRFGTDGILEMGIDASGNETDPFGGMSQEDQQAILEIMGDCVPGLNPDSLG
ncbi:MAG TPA: DUF2510 domain-containing protein [Acidimicrobiales bacterium]